MAKEKSTRVTFDFAPEAYAILKGLASALSTTKVETLRKALGLLKYIVEAKREGWIIVLERGDQRKEIVTL